MRKLVTIALSIAALFTLSSCGQAPWEDSLRDYEDATVVDPGSITLYNNVDKHPNIARVCADGVAFATTTRDYEPLTRVPEWDEFCATVEDRVMPD